MVDIESFSVHPSNATIVSAAFVKFRMEGPGPIMDLQGALVIPFDVRHQLVAGRIVDNQKWWLDQDEAVRKTACAGNPLGPNTAMSMIEEYVSDPSMPIWANGIVFDIGNIESFFLQNGRPPPWKYNCPRDARTVYNLLPKRRTMPSEVGDGTAHDPLFDCEWQIWKLWERWPFS